MFMEKIKQHAYISMQNVFFELMWMQIKDVN